MHSENRHRIEAALHIAARLPEIAVTGDTWDPDQWLLGVPNGVIDLKTGKLRAGKPGDLITRQAGVPFDEASECLRFLRFLDEIFLGRRDLINFIQRAVGYSLTGSTREEVLFVCYGTGANGKTTLLNAVTALLGDYAGTLPFSALQRTQRPTSPTDIVSIVGCRFVTASEVPATARWDEARVKGLTSRDPIVARHLYREEFTFTPAHKIWVAVNHRPGSYDESVGFWRRIRLIPFEARFDGDARDVELEDKLREELPGILAWAVRGCVQWQRESLGEPESVRDATRQYREDVDPIGPFLDERCEIAEGAAVGATKLWDAYVTWAIDRPVSRNEFAARLRTRGLDNTKRDSKGRVQWIGIRLRGGDDNVTPMVGTPEPL